MMLLIARAELGSTPACSLCLTTSKGTLTMDCVKSAPAAAAECTKGAKCAGAALPRERFRES
jgi:hypothetical protein